MSPELRRKLDRDFNMAAANSALLTALGILFSFVIYVSKGYVEDLTKSDIESRQDRQAIHVELSSFQSQSSVRWQEVLSRLERIERKLDANDKH